MQEELKDPFRLRPVWDALLEVYEVFSAICDKHGLRYYMTDGNALGAVRHRGFIPWDDDVDVSMPRPDYEKFIKLAETELPPNLKIVSWRNTPEYENMFVKVQETRREYVEKIEAATGRQLSNGIFIDVFPIDGYPDGMFGQLWYRLQIKMIMQVKRFRSGGIANRTVAEKVRWLIGAMLSVFMPDLKSVSHCHDAANRLNASVPFGKTHLTGRAATTMWKRYILPVETYGDPVYFDFDRIKVPLPQDYDAFLRYDYHDYMKLPPEDKRKPTHVYHQRCPWWLGPTRTRIGI